MVVTYVMVAVFVVGVLGAMASVLSYDKSYGDIGSPMRIPRRSRRRAPVSRPSRQLQALEAALEKDGEVEDQACSSIRSHRGWRNR